jgi:hypothetical protein
MYKLFKDPMGVKDVGVTLNGTIAIPFDEANTDYQAFLKYQAEGGVVLPADPLPAENT